jgi:DNA-binding NtrC family response regulator
MNKSILVVDDDQSINSIFEFILQQAGYNAITTNSGEGCLKIANSDQPIDLIFLDLKMPGLSGLETFKELQKIRPNILVIIMTGYSADALLKETFELGAYGIIYKPFDVEEVLSIIEKIFKHSIQKEIQD